MGVSRRYLGFKTSSGTAAVVNRRVTYQLTHELFVPKTDIIKVLKVVLKIVI